MTSEGAKSPALPPVPIVSDDAMIFARQRNRSSAAPDQPVGSHAAPVIATCAAP